MRYNGRRNAAVGRRYAPAKKSEPKRTYGAGMALLVVQTVLCAAALTVLFTMQYISPKEYTELGSLYAQVTAQSNENEQNEAVRLLTAPITAERLRQWWENRHLPKLAEVFANAESRLGMGGEEPVFPRNASYRRVAVTIPPCSPFTGEAVITSSYGERTHPISGAWDFHTGIDIAAAQGTKIYPIYAGEVTATGFSQSYGNYVKIRHCGNLETIYCHCSEVLCKTGDRVTTNDEIALVGSTGVSTGPHLHLSVLADGYYVDPMNLYS